MNNSETPALVGLPRRLAAIVYDSVLLLGTLIVAGFPWVIVTANPETAYISDEPARSLFFAWNVGLVFAYFALGWCRGGRTLGMRSWRLQLLAANGGPVTVGQAARRAGAAVIAWAPLGAGVLWQYVDRDGLTWHDRISGTRLVLLKKPSRGA